MRGCFIPRVPCWCRRSAPGLMISDWPPRFPGLCAQVLCDSQAAGADVEVEEVKKDLGAMTTEEQRAAVIQDAPELAALLADLQSSLAEVRGRVGPLLKEVTSLRMPVYLPDGPVLSLQNGQAPAAAAAAAALQRGAAVLPAALSKDKGCH